MLDKPRDRTITYEEFLVVLRDYAKEQKECGNPARMQDLREYRQWKNAPQDTDFDAKLLREINGEEVGDAKP